MSESANVCPMCAMTVKSSDYMTHLSEHQSAHLGPDHTHMITHDATGEGI